MTLNRSSIFLEIIESLSKNVHISEGNVDIMAKEILHKASHFLKIPRVNAWLFDENDTKLTCLQAYDRNGDLYYKEKDLLAESYPLYFNHIRRKDIIISFEARNESFNAELLDIYLIPQNVFSMMEVPILSGGKLKGIICFENTEKIRDWTNDEQHFALALTQLLTLTLETKEKNLYRQELEKLVSEKSVLISEINHRVKNNLAVITALIRVEANRAKDEYHKELFANVMSKSFTLSTLQNVMYDSKNYQEVNFSEFIRTLIGNMNDTYGYSLSVKLILELGELEIDISKAIPCSLIVNELLTNCYKYAFSEGRENILKITLRKINEIGIEFIAEDNGYGLPENYKKKGTGFELMNGLADQIDGFLNINSSAQGTKITLTF
jgi:two-component sensor histidine kinase